MMGPVLKVGVWRAAWDGTTNNTLWGVIAPAGLRRVAARCKMLLASHFVEGWFEAAFRFVGKQKRPPKWVAFFVYWRTGRDSNPRPPA